MTTQPQPAPVTGARSPGVRTLVVYIPSIRDRVEQWDDLVAELKSQPGYGPGECRWVGIPHGGSWWKTRTAEQLALTLAGNIDEVYGEQPADYVVLMGHSLGAMLVRRAYLVAMQQQMPWAAHVGEVLLFAGMNRGISPDHVTSRRRPHSTRGPFWFPLAAWGARVFARRWLLYDLLKGSDFVSNLRISWIRAIGTLDHPPTVIQFLGEADWLVKQGDSHDIQAVAEGREVMLPGATHADIVELAHLGPSDRAQRVRTLTTHGLRPPRAVARSAPSTGRPTTGGGEVVLLVHGIRASNTDWEQRLFEHIKQTWPDRPTTVVRATYRRFSALQFAFPTRRRKHLGWLQDTYAEYLAADPRATFHFVGHSNGTYLLGHSLTRIPGMRFARVYLAGSVLPTSFNWRNVVRRGQVQQVRNDRSSADWPVGFLCPGLVGLALRRSKKDIGTGGVDGFGWEGPDAALAEHFYVVGDHGAALAPPNLPSIAAYVMEGAGDPPPALRPDARTGKLSLMSRLAPWLFRLLALGLVAGLAWLAVSLPWATGLNVAVIAAALLLVFVVADVV